MIHMRGKRKYYLNIYLPLSKGAAEAQRLLMERKSVTQKEINQAMSVRDYALDSQVQVPQYTL